MKKGSIILFVAVLVFAIPLIANASFIEDEAGVCAFAKLSSVNLIAAATAYKNIERQTNDYIIGSVAIDDYPESDDVHVYLDVSGDIIAYYRNTEDFSKMLDWRHYTAGQPMGSKLEWALNKVCQAMSVSLGEVKTYDFRYPQAQQIKIIVDEIHRAAGPESFTLRIPDNYTIYSIEWSQYTAEDYCCGAVTTKLYVDEDIPDNQLNYVGERSWHIYMGEVPVSLISADNSYHTVYFTGDGNGWVYTAIVIIYTENQ